MSASRHNPIVRVLGRILLLVVMSSAISLGVVPIARAQINTPTKTCTPTVGNSNVAVGDTVSCTLAISATLASDMPNGTVIAVAPLGTNFTLSLGSASCTALPTSATCAAPAFQGSTAAVQINCSPTPCGAGAVTIPETLNIVAANPATITQTVSVFSPTPQSFNVQANVTIVAAAVTPGRIFYAAPGGSSTGQCTQTAPCTIERAIDLARDADTVNLQPGANGRFPIHQTVSISELLTIQPDGNQKVVLTADPGVTIFDVSAQGGPGLHVTISNFTMGGNFARGSTAPAILMENDNYTEISNNIIGAQDLPINNGIVLSNSDHNNIHDNTIQGSSRLVFSPLLLVGRTVSGFGIVTLECFGGFPAGVSDSDTIRSNLFTNQLIAGIWMCSDGAGEHVIDHNTFRNNWRGIALKDVTNSTISNNTLTDERNDGIILYGASLRNSIQGNQIESHIAADAAAIRVGWVADPIAPLSNNVTGNTLIRDTVGLHIFGARTTVVKTNEFKISGVRTAILITPSTAPGDPGTQPFDTEITANVIVFIGPCAPVIGCGIRLVGTTVPVLATDNDWGLRHIGDIQGVIWDQVDDPVLGLVSFVPFRNQMRETATATATPGSSSPPSSSSPPPSAAPTSSPGTSAVTTRVPLDPGCATVDWPGASGVSVVDAVMGISALEAQRTAVIWRSDGDDWKAWGPGLPSRAPRQVFTLQRNDTLQVCVGQRTTWLIPTQVGGP